MINRLIWFIRFWLPVLLVMGFIFHMSSVPGQDLPELFPFQDIVFHGIIYSLLALIFFRALSNTLAGAGYLIRFLLTVVFVSIYGASDEFHQLFVPGRSFSLLDMAVDSGASFLGAAMGGVLIK